MDSYEEEEESTDDEFANMAINTHELRAEKVRLQERLEVRQTEIENEIREMKNKLRLAQDKLMDFDFSTRYLQKSSYKPPPQPLQKSTTFIAAERELYSAKQKLELLNEDYSAQNEKQKMEIKKLMNKAKKAKLILEARSESIEASERKKNDSLDENQDLQIKLHNLKKETRIIENEAKHVEDEVLTLISEAEHIVSKRYRGKSKHVK